MKKFSISIAAMVLIAVFLVSCKDKSETAESKTAQTEHQKPHGDHPPQGERPPNGDQPPHGKEDRKRPPGGGHGPEQTKTLEEIGGV